MTENDSSGKNKSIFIRPISSAVQAVQVYSLLLSISSVEAISFKIFY